MWKNRAAINRLTAPDPPIAITRRQPPAVTDSPVFLWPRGGSRKSREKSREAPNLKDQGYRC